jgi:hypothetical protein
MVAISSTTSGNIDAKGQIAREGHVAFCVIGAPIVFGGGRPRVVPLPQSEKDPWTIHRFAGANDGRKLPRA